VVKVIVRRTRQFAIRLSDDERNRLDRLAEHYGIDVPSVIRMVIKKDYDLIVKTCQALGNTESQ
jgi:predicted DNA-binding protein